MAVPSIQLCALLCSAHSIPDYIVYNARMIGDDKLERTLNSRAYVSLHCMIWP